MTRYGSAWLIAWESSESEIEVVALLSARYGEDRIATILEVLHDSLALTPEEQLSQNTRRRKDRIFPISRGRVITVGHNPYLIASRIFDVTAGHGWVRWEHQVTRYGDSGEGRIDESAFPKLLHRMLPLRYSD